MSRVLVIGAGPAGSVFAIRMAMLGHEVTLVERAAFPRRRLGEALTPGVRPLLEAVGAGDAIAHAGGRPVAAIRQLWDGPEGRRLDPAAAGCIIDRGRLDARLLEIARAAGVVVRQTASVVARTADATGWRLVLSTAQGPVHWRGDFLADATGRTGQGIAQGPRTIAAHAYWRLGVDTPPEPCIEAGAQAWFWGVPLPGGLYNTLVICRPETLRAARGTTLQARLRTLLAQSRLLRGLSGRTCDGPVGARDATPRISADPVGPRFIRVGDAALSLDPISSSGVQKAIQGALAAAVTANTLLRRPEAGTTALAFYRDSLRRTADRHRRWATAHYATAAATRPDRFWQERAAGAPDASSPPGPALDAQLMRMRPARVSPLTRIGIAPCLGAEFVSEQPVVTHPGIDGPIAYLGGHAIAPLLARFPQGATPLEVARSWGDRVPLKPALAILARLLDDGVIVLEPPETGTDMGAQPGPAAQ
ncbi:tryptophan 7-halogenase [Rhodobaculum claviforme]|uniref:flavin-dependent monooxygenase QhpG n=1 Tax=Rhodobaculum claviforme TaxID=1549854 RepID=UPI00191131F4